MSTISKKIRHTATIILLITSFLSFNNISFAVDNPVQKAPQLTLQPPSLNLDTTTLQISAPQPQIAPQPNPTVNTPAPVNTIIPLPQVPNTAVQPTTDTTPQTPQTDQSDKDLLQPLINPETLFSKMVSAFLPTAMIFLILYISISCFRKICPKFNSDFEGDLFDWGFPS